MWAQGTRMGGSGTRAGFVQWAGSRTESPRAPPGQVPTTARGFLRPQAGGNLSLGPSPCPPSPGARSSRGERSAQASEGRKSSLEATDRKDWNTGWLFTVPQRKGKHWALQLALPTQGAQGVSVAEAGDASGFSLPAPVPSLTMVLRSGITGSAYLRHLRGLHSVSPARSCYQGESVC